MTNLIASLPIIALIISILTLIGSFIALKTGYGRTASDIQTSVISALKTENEVLQDRVARLEKDVLEEKAESRRLNNLIALVIETLAKRGTTIEIENDLIVVRESSGAVISARQQRKEPTPIHLPKTRARGAKKPPESEQTS